MNVLRRSALEPSLVLAPERYDLRRAPSFGHDAVPLRTLVAHALKIVRPSHDDSDARLCVVLDTSDARDGMIVGSHGPLVRTDLGSSKKVFGRGDVLISRLRPYLRQVAWVDDGWVRAHHDRVLVCSTEFHVLSPVDGGSLAFIVPWLLSVGVQRVLSTAQEGGHHPRYNLATLLGLRLPKQLVERRADLSASVIAAVDGFRASTQAMASLVQACTDAMPREG